jgi:peroxiredoxin
MSSNKSLKERIDALTAGMSTLPPEVGATLAAELEKLVDSGIANRALGVGAVAPDFSLPNAQGGDWQLSTALARGPVVLSFYRGSWCPFCDLQLRAYQERLQEMRRLGGELVAVSPQTPDFAQTDVDTKQLTFPVLTDAHNAVARQYGLVFTLSDELKKLQEGFGNPIPKFNGDDSWELPMPGTFIIDGDGVIRLAYVDANYMRRLEPSAIVDALAELRDGQRDATVPG